MSNFDQKKQKVNNQVNAENLNINIGSSVGSTEFACPLCMNNNSTQKLSAIVKGDTQTSKLGEYLSLPPESGMPDNSGLGISLLIGFWILFCILCFAVAFLVDYIFYIFDLDLSDSDYLLVLGYAGIFAGLIAAPIISKKITNRKIPKQKIQFELDHQNWQQAKNKWEKSYYCHRHDIVFIPGNDETVSPEKFKEFLYKKSSLNVKTQPTNLRTQGTAKK